MHRDVKPPNILIAESTQHVYLTDFGVARQIGVPGLTQTGSFIGTVEYSAPEQISGKEVDARTDVYALAGVLFHCLAGQPPYARGSDVAVIHAHLLDPPPALTPARPDLHGAFDDVMRAGMAKYPEARYRSCSALIEAARNASELGPQPVAETVPTPPPTPAANRPPVATPRPEPQPTSQPPLPTLPRPTPISVPAGGFRGRADDRGPSVGIAPGGRRRGTR